MKILTAHQTAYLPWAGLIHKISLADKFCLFDDVAMSNDDWERRQYIKTANGPTLLTIPLQSKGYRDKKLYQLEIDNTQRWRDKHWKTIQLAYKKAKYFNEYEPFFNTLFQQEYQYLTEFNEYFLRHMLQILKIDIEFCKASDLNFEGQKSELVLDMCKKLDADIYIFGSQGESYADKAAFERAGIKLYFQHYNCSRYNQLWGKEFIERLSIVDLLFNVGAEKTKEILVSGNISKKQLMEECECQLN